MPSRSRRRLQRVTALGVVLYALFLVVAPFEHHDLICHLKTPQHCTSCVSSQVGSSIRAPIAAGTYGLLDAGLALTYLPSAAGVLLIGASRGRSPPVPV